MGSLLQALLLLDSGHPTQNVLLLACARMKRSLACNCGAESEERSLICGMHFGIWGLNHGVGSGVLTLGSGLRYDLRSEY